MQKNCWASRRALLAGLAIVPLSQCSTEAMATDDAKLIILGRKLASVAAEIDHSIERGPDIAVDAFEQFSHITAEILTIQAKTIDGLGVKARAACWALLGDLDPADDLTLDKSMALSIVRDLIRLQNPHLEHPGALRKLVEDATNGATKSIAHQTTCDNAKTGRAITQNSTGDNASQRSCHHAK